jgi:diaminopimelate decarboxylase
MTGNSRPPVPWPAQQWSPGQERAALPAAALPGPVVERLRRLVRAAEGEPLSGYVYDPADAARRAARLRAALPGWAEVHYAVKANSFPAVLEALAPSLDGFDVSSSGELRAARAALAASGAPGTLIATGPGKSDRMLRELVREGVEFISVESELELHRLAGAAARAGRRAPVVLRVNSGSGPLDGALRMDGRATQFGITERELPAAVTTARALDSVELLGFHFHVVSGNLDARAHAAYVRSRLRFSAEAAHRFGIELRVVDAGGGLGVTPYGEPPFDLGEFTRLLGEQAPADGVRVVLEPGRWLVAPCGYYAAEVTDLKEVGGVRFAVLGGGINHFMLPALLEVALNAAVLPVGHWPYRCPRPELRDTPVSFAGPLCTPEDILARGIRVERLRVGDLVVFPLAGAYGWEFALHGFLARGPALRTTVAEAMPYRASGASAAFDVRAFDGTPSGRSDAVSPSAPPRTPGDSSR